VDIESVIIVAMKGCENSVKSYGSRYSLCCIRYISNKGISIRFRTEATMDDALVLLREKLPSLLFTQPLEGLGIFAAFVAC